mgnify:CR=1 FL=1
METDTLAAAQQLDFSFLALFLRATLTVKLVMILLIIASFWSWAIIIQRHLIYRRVRSESTEFDQAFWSGEPLDQLFEAIGPQLRDLRFSAVSYWFASAILVALWLLALSLADTRTPGVVGAGTTEYVRVIDSSLVLFGVIAIVAFLFRVDIARGYLLISLPAGILLLLLVRWLWRQWLVAKRRVGKCASGVILIGSPASVAQVGHELQQRRDTGYLVVGACLPPELSPEPPSGDDPLPDADIPVLGTFDDLARVLAETGADTVLVTSSDALPPEKVKQISWSLEAGRQHLLLAPGIADVAGPRIHTRPVSGLPLVHVETPRFSPGQRFGKRMADLILSLVAVVVADRRRARSRLRSRSTTASSNPRSIFSRTTSSSASDETTTTTIPPDDNNDSSGTSTVISRRTASGTRATPDRRAQPQSGRWTQPWRVDQACAAAPARRGHYVHGPIR